jgi:hypothetical protein
MVNDSVRFALLFSPAEQHLRLRGAERRLTIATAHQPVLVRSTAWPPRL